MERLLGHTDSVYTVAFSPDSNGVVSGSLDNTTKYWDLRTLLARSEGCRCLVDYTGHQVSWGLWLFSLFKVGMLIGTPWDRIMCYRLQCRMTASGLYRARRINVCTSGTCTRDRRSSRCGDTRTPVRVRMRRRCFAYSFYCACDSGIYRSESDGGDAGYGEWRSECEDMCVFSMRFFIALSHDAGHREIHDALTMGGGVR